MKTLLLVLIVAAIHYSQAAKGAVFERDWKPPGDGLLTYDDVNQREWLDLTETLLAKFPATLPADIPQMYQNVVAETLPGGRFDGFMVASESDVVALAQSAGIDTSTLSISTNLAASDDLIDLLGPTREQSGGRRLTLGMLTEYTSTALLRITPQVNEAGLSTAPITADRAEIPTIAGVWLYRQVPEPNTVRLIAYSIGIYYLRRCTMRFR